MYNMEHKRTPFAINLKAIRENRKWTQVILSIRSGVQLSHLQRLEQGVAPEPKLSVLMALAAALDTDIETLLGVDIDEATRKKGMEIQGHGNVGSGPGPWTS